MPRRPRGVKLGKYSYVASMTFKNEDIHLGSHRSEGDGVIAFDLGHIYFWVNFQQSKQHVHWHKFNYVVHNLDKDGIHVVYQL